MTRLIFVFCGLLAAICSVSASAQIIDHSDVDAVSAYPQSTMNLIGQQKWFFTHASVGGNMLSGLSDLRSQNSTRYQLRTSNVTYDTTNLRAASPTTTAAGYVYECNRGNPTWQDKTTIFANSLNVSGWHEGAVDVVMNKFCYIDPSANASTYLTSMSGLEAAHPLTRFVYMTMPLMTTEDADNIKRNDFNDAVRSYCLLNNRLLFDLADIEAHAPDGTAYTFVSGSKTYQKLYSGYTTDGGHLGDAGNVGRDRVALGWYATAAAIAVPESSQSVHLVGILASASILGLVRLWNRNQAMQTTSSEH